MFVRQLIFIVDILLHLVSIHIKYFLLICTYHNIFSDIKLCQCMFILYTYILVNFNNTMISQFFR